MTELTNHEKKYIITPEEIPADELADFLTYIRGRCCPMEGYWRVDWNEYLLHKKGIRKSVL